jgi:NHL repeat-containing protein
MRRVRSQFPWSVGRLSFVVLVVAALLAPSAALAAPKGVVGFFGNPSAAGGTLGNQFSTAPGGVAVNDSTGDVYVVDSANHRVQRFDADGGFDWAIGFDVIAPGKPGGNVPLNEQQTVTVGANTTGGSFTLRYGGTTPAFTSAAIPWNASAAQVDAALEGIAGIGAGNVDVTSSNPGGGAAPGGPYTVEFVGALADTNTAQMTSVATGLVATGTKSVTIATTVDGGGRFEKCVVAADCKAGINIATAPGAPGGEFSTPQGVAVNQVTGDFYVSDPGFQRIQQFTADGAFVRAWGRDVVQAGKPGDDSPASAVRTLTVDASAGTFTLTFKGQTTGDLAFDASAATVQAALQGLGSIGVGNVTVTPAGATGGAGGGTPYVITYAGTLASSAQPTITTASGSTPLAGGAATATVQNTVAGSSGFEVCNTAVDCKQGVAGGTAGAFANTLGYPAVAPAGAPNGGNVLIAEPGTGRVEEFTANGGWVRAFGFDVAAGGPGNTGTGFEICSATGFDVCKAGVTAAPTDAPGKFGAGAVRRVAVDSTGVIYTVEADVNFRVQRFTPAGPSLTPSVFNPEISAVPAVSLSGTSAADSPTDVAIGPSSRLLVVKGCTAVDCPDALLASERRIYEFTSAGTLVETHAAGYSVPSVNGFAVEASGGRFFATASTPTPRVNIFGDPVPPTVSVAATTAVTSSAATLHGSVNPNGGDPGLQTTYRFEYSANGTDWTKAPATNVDIGGGTDPVVVSQSIAALQPNKHYQVRLVANKGGSLTTSSGTVGDFDTDGAPPSVETYPALFDGAASELVLRAGVNPNNTATSYYFEYGTQSCAANPCVSVPVGQDGSAGAGGQKVTVTQRVGGLDPDTVYHFRVVADNGVEVSAGVTEVRGLERTFRTPQSQDECANAEYRVGPSAGLPDCMAYERVSDGDSWGVGIFPNVGAVADGGGRVQFPAQAFGNPESVPAVQNVYTAERGGSGWDVTAMVPEPDGANGHVAGISMPSSDLGSTLWPESSVLQSLRGEVRWTLVGLDGSRTAASELLVPLSHRGNDDKAPYYEATGASGDLSTFTFRNGSSSSRTFFSDEYLFLSDARTNLYTVSGADSGDPVFGIVNRETNPSPAVAGALIGGACGAGLGGRIDPTQDTSSVAEGAVSADGSVVYFSAAPTAPATGVCSSTAGIKRLYKRVGGTTTVAVSESQCVRVSPVCAGVGSDEYRGASTDGSIVFFTSSRQLADSDLDTTSDLYVYDSSPPAGRPSLVQASAGEAVVDHPTVGSGANVAGFVATAADGSRAYFLATGALTGANSRGVSPVVGQRNMYVFERDDTHPDGRIVFVGALAAGEAANVDKPFFALPNEGLETDGRFLLFTSAAALVGEDGDVAADVYRYDDSTGELLCLSCMGDANAPAAIADRDPQLSQAAWRQVARSASGDVSKVVFTTTEQLLATDQNTVRDVYLWDDGSLSLVSGGTGELGVSYTNGVGFATAISPDGQNVFFTTRSPLVGSDVNNQIDLYVARVGGGYPAPPPPGEACEALADACQGGGAGSVELEQKTPPAGGDADAGDRVVLALRQPSLAARKRVARNGVLRVAVRSNKAGVVRLSAKARINGDSKTVGQVARTLAKPGTITVGLRLNRAARRQLRNGHPLRLVVAVRSADARMRTIAIRLPGATS